MKQPQEFYPLKTLIIDDDPFVRSTFELMFEEIGWSLDTAESAEKGLMAMERQDYDIIVSDFTLPEMNGLEFFKQVMATRPVSINILMSAYGNDEIISRAFEIGVDDFLQKPFNLRQLSTKIRRILNSKS